MVETVEIKAEDGVKLKGWLVNRTHSKRIIVFLHGNFTGTYAAS